MAPTVAIAHDYFTQRGGAERVALAMVRAFPGAELHTALYHPEGTYPGLADLAVHESPLARVPGLRARHRLGFLAYAAAFGRMRPDADVVLCSSSGWAHGIGGDAPKVVYCHTPARWLYRTHDFHFSLPVRAMLAAAGPPLRRWDRRQARGAVRYLTNAPGIAARIAEAYGIDAEVLHPPVSIDPSGQQQPVPGVGSGIVLCVSRLLPYKHVDVVVAAAADLRDLEVIVVGDGPEAPALVAAAPANVRFLSAVTDDELRWLYARAAVLVAPAEEDFGLTPVEAAAFAVPTVARGWGGHLQTVVDGVTGVLLPGDVTGASLAAGVRAALGTRWEPDALRAHANDLSEPAFARRLGEVVGEVISGS